jgi:hypothetical protein
MKRDLIEEAVNQILDESELGFEVSGTEYSRMLGTSASRMMRSEIQSAVDSLRRIEDLTVPGILRYSGVISRIRDIRAELSELALEV